MPSTITSKQLAFASAGLAAVLLGIRFLRRRLFSSDPYDGLDGIVSYSSRFIAAARAREAEEDDPLVNDPLASLLAGPKALRDSRARQQPAPPASHRKFKINSMAIRTKWFDDQLEASLGMPIDPSIPSSLSTSQVDPYIVSTAAPGSLPKQVVILGAGMDSRPWRLKLPEGLQWFEVDRGDVLESKTALLRNVGAEVGDSRSLAAVMSRSVSTNTRLEQKIGTIDHHASGIRYPLRTGSWECVIADLESPDWRESLLAAGFDPGKPTVWIAEGLLMYLEELRVPALLREIAEVSANGSALLMMTVTKGVIRDMQARGASSKLFATWKFGIPEDHKQWLAASGWKTEVTATRASMARALRLAPEICGFETEVSASKYRRSLFIAATPILEGKNVYREPDAA